jgi:hypothetical protein
MGWLVDATPQPLDPREIPGTYYIGGWVGPRAGLGGCGKPRIHTGIRSPERPARSESLYRLSYPDPVLTATEVSLGDGSSYTGTGKIINTKYKLTKQHKNTVQTVQKVPTITC